MNLNDYTICYLLNEYGKDHSDLTAAARELLRRDIAKRPEKYATTPRARALVQYRRTRSALMRGLDAIGDLQDDDFAKSRFALFAGIRASLLDIAKMDEFFAEPKLLAILLDHAQPDGIVSDLLKLEAEVRDQLSESVAGFDIAAPHFWISPSCARENSSDAADLTAASLEVIGWLHILEALSQQCMQTARYRRAADYARLVMRAEGYPNHAEGTVMLALARLEDEPGFFELAHRLCALSEEHRAEAPGSSRTATADSPAAMRDSAPDHPENSPWYLLARTILLYKLGKTKAARRALRDFNERCDGGAFFLLNPTYLDPYLPVRPEPRDSWDLPHQAVWEADAIISDTPDFVPWAESVEGTLAISDAFASRNGF
ncbi:hypothetical protein Corgl_1415 [Coriobacterium glomerans PW2]|uniref:Uncharacterized protein n=1 Tax=Coriobacterium glomerans (strain ATCC 49209 / DSM 20642 / JCM 10262 / PW2) TaxID=700015 RepID=F2NAR0_CORGP|nr:hypothetical protein [Coriobacterium glomerans]AEB07516.1 hypothetical protein Corgl_1415 [Coriobacterium glomerans PW2]